MDELSMLAMAQGMKRWQKTTHEKELSCYLLLLENMKENLKVRQAQRDMWVQVLEM